MTIRDRLLDARLLVQNKRYEGALLQLLVAIAAAARKQFPPGTPSSRQAGAMGDREAFETYLGPRIPPAIPTGLRGSPGSGILIQVGNEDRLLEEILYKWYRCSLIHEAQLHQEVELEIEDEFGLSIQASGPGNKCTISRGILDVLYRVLSGDSRLAAEFSGLDPAVGNAVPSNATGSEPATSNTTDATNQLRPHDQIEAMVRAGVPFEIIVETYGEQMPLESLHAFIEAAEKKCGRAARRLENAGT